MMHHACLLRQDQRDIDRALVQYNVEAHSEVLVLQHETITIGDVRAIIAAANRRPSSEAQQLLVVCFSAIHAEAEQALLKIIEEPPLTTKFLFVVPYTYRPLPTISSRVLDITIRTAESKSVALNKTFVLFLNSQYKDRLALAVQGSGEAKDVVWVAAMKLGLSQYITTHQTQLSSPVLKVYLDILSLLDSKGASNKMLFEELALTLPVP